MLMNKFLRYSLVAFLAVMGLSVHAGSIVFGELGLENGVQYSDPFDGGDFTVTFAGGGNDGKYYTTGSGIRVYGGGTMTIAAKSGTLSKIIVTYHGTNKPESANVVDVGSYDASTGTWTGNAEQVVFTRPSGSGHWRVQKIETGADAQGPEVPTEGQTPETAITATRALELINGLADGAITDFPYYVKGVVTSIANITTDYAQFYFAETADATETIQTYQTKGLGNTTISNLEFIKANDEVVVYGALQKYIKSGTVVPEITGGYVYSVNGKTTDDTPNPEDAITKGLTADAPMTVDEALSYINSFSDGFITTKDYYVQGEVGAEPEISTANGNATFTMAGTDATLTIYRVKGLENKNITDEGYLREQDQVIVLAKLQKYVKDGVVTPEMSKGYIYMLNGETKEDTPEPQPVEFVGDGSKENPYTVADLKQMTSDTYPAESVWVKGVIIGAAKSGTSLETEKEVLSNIAIAATADATEFIPVELKKDTEFRAKLNIVDNPTVIGKEVKLCGTITAYFSVTGMKNLTDYELEGGESIQGDANGDGVVDVADVDFVIEAIGGEYAKAADVNGDGAVDVADVDFIIEQIQ